MPVSPVFAPDAEPVPDGDASLGMANDAIREALADFCIWLPPEQARKMAISCLRLAAALVSLASEMDGAAGTRGAASEFLLMLAEGLPHVPEAA